MTKLSISRAWDETRAILARDGKLLATVAAALFLLPQVLVGFISGQSTSAEPPGGAGLLLMFLAAIIGLIGQLAVVRMAIGQGVSVGEAIGHGFRRALPFLLSLLLMLVAFALLFMIAVMILRAVGAIDLQAVASGGTPRPQDVGLILLVIFIPLLYVGVRLLVLAAVASEERHGPLAALRRSWALTAGNGWRLFGFVVIFIIGAIIVTVAVAMVAGLIVRLFVGSVEPLTAGALVLALFGGLAQAAVTLVYVVMIARIYAQVAGERNFEEVFR